MSESLFLSPPQIAEETIKNGIKKASLPVSKMLLLGFLAGGFIAFAAEGSNMAAFNLFMNADTYGLGKALAGAIFGAGLIFVIVAGGELFTGNVLISVSVMHKQVAFAQMLKNWFFVYIGNFIGSVVIAWMMNKSGLFASGASGLGVVTMKIASYKVGLSFGKAFFLGVMCNWLVCLAVWMAWGAKDIPGKVLVIFFPIWLFVTSGFEHSIANMYYIPAGIIAKGNQAMVDAALSHGMTAEMLNALNWKTCLVNNLLPVTLGNIIGGGVFVACIYWFCYLRKNKVIDSAATEAVEQVPAKVVAVESVAE